MITLCLTINPVIVGEIKPAIEAMPLAIPTIKLAYLGAKSKKLILQWLNTVTYR